MHINKMFASPAGRCGTKVQMRPVAAQLAGVGRFRKPAPRRSRSLWRTEDGLDLGLRMLLSNAMCNTFTHSALAFVTLTRRRSANTGH